MYSRTRTWTATQLDTMQMGVKKLDSSTKKSEMPSTPRR